MAKLCQTEFANRRKSVLEDSLLTLLYTKSYQEITVKDICQQAQIPRRTFYHYFEGKEDVLDALIENLIHDCNLQVMFDFGSGYEEMKQSFVRFFRFWDKEKRQILNLLTENKIHVKLVTSAVKWNQQESVGFFRAQALDPKLVEIGTMTAAINFFALLFYWNRNDYRETPEEMGEYAAWIFSQPLYKP